MDRVEEIRAEVIQMFSDVGVVIDDNTNADVVADDFDSLQFIALICDLEEKYGISITEEELILDNYENLNQFVDLVVRKICEQEAA
jgi:acyl carrier protein